MTIHQTLKNTRKAAGLTQLQLAEKCGLKREAITRAEAGRNLGLHTLKRICDALGLVIQLSKKD